MKGATKSLVTKTQADTALEMADKNKEKKKILQAFDLSYFNGRRYFGDDGSWNYVTFKPISNTFTMTTGDTETIIAWKSKGLSGRSIKPRATSSNSLAPKLKWIHNSKIAVEFKDRCSK